MARSFSQEARSDSHKIGETRCPLSHLPSTTAIARTLLLAGILLAVALLATRSFFPAFAQETDTIEYEENNTDSVTVYSAEDPEGEDIKWSLPQDVTASPDAGFFSIDGGVLSFKSPPDYECPKDTTADPCGGIGNGSSRAALLTANTYTVDVQANAGTSGNDPETRTVIVNVIDVDEPGMLTFNTAQPKVGVDIVATLTDNDGSISDDGQTRYPQDETFSPPNNVDIAAPQWQWATSTSATSDEWNPIKPTADPDDDAHDGDDATYKPRASDEDIYLRVTVTYADGTGENDPFTDDVDESMLPPVHHVFTSPVLARDYMNRVPKFPDQDPDPKNTDTSREFEVDEDASSGGN